MSVSSDSFASVWKHVIHYTVCWTSSVVRSSSSCRTVACVWFRYIPPRSDPLVGILVSFPWCMLFGDILSSFEMFICPRVVTHGFCLNSPEFRAPASVLFVPDCSFRHPRVADDVISLFLCAESCSSVFCVLFDACFVCSLGSQEDISSVLVRFCLILGEGLLERGRVWTMG